MKYDKEYFGMAMLALPFISPILIAMGIMVCWWAPLAFVAVCVGLVFWLEFWTDFIFRD